MGAPLVSIIIPTYNRAYIIKRAIDSVLAQTYHNYELIVVDDASSDETRVILQKYLNIPHFIYLQHQYQCGVSAARNYGLQNSRGDFICFLDSDDLWYPDKLAIQVKYMQTNPQYKISQVAEIWIRRGKRVNPLRKHTKPHGDVFMASLELCLISPSAVMIAKDVFEQVGNFDCKLLACEDYDLWLRISLRYEVALIEKFLIEKHGGHADQLSQQYWGMDRFRIYALEKLLKMPQMNKKQKKAVVSMLRKKVRIIARGAFKRHKWIRAISYFSLQIYYSAVAKCL